MLWARIKKYELGNKNKEVSGFTIIELLIVIVIIAILAAITIVAYNGITQKADVATLTSDLAQDYTTLGMAQVTNGAYPANQAAAGLKSSPNVALAYSPNADNSAYCLQAIGYGQVYAVTSNNNVPIQGYCSGDTIMTGTGNTYFDLPVAITTGSSGALYVADAYNNCIREITDGGAAVPTLAGICGASPGTSDGTGPSAQFDYPFGLALDNSGNLYVADGGGSCIRKITPTAVVTTFAGTCGNNGSTAGSANGTGSSAQFYWPAALVFNRSGDLYVADSDNSCIREVTPNAVVTTFAGTCAAYPSSVGTANGTGSAAQFDVPSGLALDSSGNLYVADSDNDCIRRITPSAVVTTFAGTCGTNGSTRGFASGTGPAAQFTRPFGLVFDSSGNLYVTDMEGNCVQRITSAAVVTTFAGTCGNAVGTANGTGSAAQFDEPMGITIDSTGNLYVVDDNNNCIRKITPAAVVTTFVGTCSAARRAV